MSAKRILAALAFVLFGGTALAAECSHDTAQSCAEGFVWDSEIGACKEQVSS